MRSRQRQGKRIRDKVESIGRLGNVKIKVASKVSQQDMQAQQTDVISVISSEMGPTPLSAPACTSSRVSDGNWVATTAEQLIYRRCSLEGNPAV